ncbi:MAG: hypothetical protein ACRDDY_14190 [Clostridium sp.]|uniref:hypothetical protein n=1 Tax=Clostridium sp. TaxID=1506 RepID=UPI003EE42A43
MNLPKNLGLEYMLVRNFNRMFSAIRIEQFGKPRIANINALEFPRGSIIHMLPTGTDSLGPSQNLPFLVKSERQIMVRHITKYDPDHIQGKPIDVIRSDLQPKLISYHRANRRMRVLKNEHFVEQDDKTLVVENYVNLPYMYRYQHTQMSWYDRYCNIYSTVWSQVAHDAAKFDRNNYIIIDLPEVMPSIKDLRIAEFKRTMVTLENIKEDAQLLFLDLWTWLGKDRSRSLMNIIGDKDLIEINLILRSGNKFTNLNLGELNYWRTGVGSRRLAAYDGKVGRECYRSPEGEQQINVLCEKLGLEHVSLSKLNTRLGFEATETKVRGLIDDRQAQNRLYATCVALMTEGRKNDLIESATQAILKDDNAQADELEDISEEELQNAKVVIGRADPVDEETQISDEESLAKELSSYEEAPIDEEQAFTIADKQTENLTRTAEEIAREAFRPSSPEECVDKACRQYIEAGVMSAKAYETFKEISATYKTLPNPNGPGLLGDNLEATEEEQVLKEEVVFDDDFILDKSMAKTSTRQMDRKYIKEIMQKDINATVMALQRGGFPILNYEVERITDAANDTELHTIEVATIKGSTRTPLRIVMPHVSRYGTFRANNVEYSMKRQRVDLPIRKIAPDCVALTSFYGKTFVTRSGKVVHNYGNWLVNNIRAMGENDKDLNVTSVRYSNVFDRTVQTPRDYAAISTAISEFKAKGIQFYFDYKRIPEVFDTAAVKELVKSNLLPVGKRGDAVYGMDVENQVYRLSKGESTHMGSLCELLEIDLTKAPYEMATVAVSDKEIPLGLVFCYYEGLQGMLDLFKIEHRMIDPAERYKPAQDEFVLKLADCKLIVSPRTRRQELVCNGLRPYIKVMAPFTFKDMNTKDVYQVLIAKDKMPPYYLNTLDHMDDLFIDPITLRILKKMKEPLTWRGLLYRSSELIAHDNHPEEMDLKEQHIYGHQRIVGAMYNELVRAMRDYQSKPSNSRKRIDIKSRAVWDRIQSDGSVAPVSDCNALHYIMQTSIVTAGGTGGRSRRSLTKPTRRYTHNNLGVISGDGVDNGDAGSTEYLAADAQINNIDGIISPDIDRSNLNPAQYMSMAAMTAPELYFDDGKRQVFYRAQYGSTTSALGYCRAGLLTGAETLIAHHTGPTQANVAIDDGRVTEITDMAITVTYGSGKSQYQETYPVGRHFGNHEGHVYPHDLVSNVKIGEKVNKGKVISYNSKYFRPNIWNKDQVDWMMGTVDTVVFMEHEVTLEDTNALSPELSQKLSTEGTVLRDIVASAKDEIHRMLKEGDHVNADTILCYIEDALTAGNDAFSEQSVETLRSIQSQAPKAKTAGTIDRIEVFYNGELEDMTESVRKLAMASDRRRKKAAGIANIPVTTGRVDGTMRIAGAPIEVDQVLIRVYISHWSPAIGGSKVVFGNQMKSTIREVYPVEIKTELDEKVGAIFGKVSNDNRIVNSIYRICCANTVAMYIGSDTLKIIRGLK